MAATYSPTTCSTIGVAELGVVRSALPSAAPSRCAPLPCLLPAALGGHCCVGSHRQRSATLLGLVTFVNRPSLIFVILSFIRLFHSVRFGIFAYPFLKQNIHKPV